VKPAIELASVLLGPFDARLDGTDFKEQVIKHLPLYYDEIDASFAESILRTHELGYDPVGHFTLRKTILRIIYGSLPIGYCVVTEKRGGSIKIGPTILEEQWRGQGIGTYVRSLLATAYVKNGVRKAYSTVADNKIESYRYLVKSGYSVEAHLRQHYSSDHGELVFGQLYDQAYKALVGESKYDAPRCQSIIRKSNTVREQLLPYLINGMMHDYTIDDTFVRDLFAAEDRGQQNYVDKGKNVFVALDKRGKILGSAVTTLKRGRAVKVAPFLCSSLDAAPMLVSAFEKHYSECNARRLMILVPCYQRKLQRVLCEYGFEEEGLLREPYRRGVDMQPFALNIGSGDNSKGSDQLLLSILPDPVNRIIAGTKLFELRKQVPTRPIRGMFLYTTGNVGAVQIYVETLGYYKMEKHQLWEKIGNYAASKERFDAYFRNYSVGYAIAISKVFILECPVSLAQLRSIDPQYRVPIQFHFMREGAPIYIALAEAKQRSRSFETKSRSIVEALPDNFHWAAKA
jgi:predicted transcriptional regulator